MSAADGHRASEMRPLTCSVVASAAAMENNEEGMRETRLLEAALEIVHILDTHAKIALFPGFLDAPPTHGHVLIFSAKALDYPDLKRAASHIKVYIDAIKTTRKCDVDAAIYADSKHNLLAAHVVPLPLAAGADFVAKAKAPGSLLKTVEECLCEHVVPLADPISACAEPAGQQTPAEIVALCPHLSSAHAAKVLLVDAALGNVPHFWAQKAVDGMTFSVVEPEGATEEALVERVRFISATYAKGRRVALTLNESGRCLTVVVPRPPSSPKYQTIDDLLDLCPTLTAREAIFLNNVLSALTLVPTEWVADDSGHTFDNNGLFARGSKIVNDVKAAYTKAKSKSPNCHVVLSLHRVNNASKDLVYSFIVLSAA